jgi:Ca-activated chloride channel family protein
LAAAAGGVPALERERGGAVSFGSPLLLLFLLAIPAAVVVYLALDRRRRERAAGWSSPALLPNMATDPGWRRTIPAILLLLAAAFLLVGFARPEARFTESEPGATIVVALDISGSMAATDVRPSRLAAADEILASFVDKLPSGYRVALLTFAQDYAVRVPPTTVKAAFVAALPRTTQLEGTAMGDAVVAAVQVAHRAVAGGKGSAHPPATVLLVSDGGLNAGNVSATQAAADAKKAGVPVSAIALGTPAGVVNQKIKVSGSSQTFNQTTQVPVESQTLKEIASGSGGALFQGGASPAQLDEVYRELGQHLVHDRKLREITAEVTGGGIALILVAALLSGIWFRRVV